MEGRREIENSLDALEDMLNQAKSGDGISMDPETIVDPIDMEEISNESERNAVDLVTGLSKIYFNDQFMEDNPGLKKRIDTFIESMRLLIKMRKSSERTHDILVSHLPEQPTNASLYRSQAQIEANLLNIQKQIDDTISSMTNMLKGYQLEINFRDQEETDTEQQEEKDTHRGSKTFIQQMQQKQQKNSANGQKLDLFTGTGLVDEFTGEFIEENNLEND